jgi:O-antigen ligase
MLLGLVGLVWDHRPWGLIKLSKASILFVLLGLSQSATAEVLVFAALAIAVISAFRGLERALVIAIIAGTIATAVTLLPDLLNVLLAAGDKNTTLTGRTEIWAFTFSGIYERPLFGFGLAGFWITMDTTARRIFGWNPKHAHNGFLEVAVESGLIGLATLIACLVSSFRLGMRTLRNGYVDRGRMLLYILVLLVLHDLTETDFLQVTPFWFMFLLTTFNCAWQEHLDYLRSTERTSFATETPANMQLAGS